MPRRSSNSERIARLAAEAAATAKEKEETKKAKAAAKAAAPRKRATRAPKAPQRMKMVWGVGKHGQSPEFYYEYRDRDAAEADAAKRGSAWVARPIKMPMGDDE